jgi:hypothetical protein
MVKPSRRGPMVEHLVGGAIESANGMPAGRYVSQELPTAIEVASIRELSCG